MLEKKLDFSSITPAQKRQKIPQTYRQGHLFSPTLKTPITTDPFYDTG
jgi:hypothetical protein